ncbi:MAG: hypothetical protein OEY10_04610 [Nitrosopumilus sp.]|nr:hypothetical protein [Nitrosopumilus sp.]
MYLRDGMFIIVMWPFNKKTQKNKCSKCDMTFENQERLWTHYYKIHKKAGKKIKYSKKNKYGIDQVFTDPGMSDGYR